MKICFFLQRKFTYLGHQIAIELKNKYGVKDFCAYVNLRPGFNFLKNQKDINYTSLILDEEIHNSFGNEPLDLEYIKNLEKEYGFPNLWHCLTVDRIISHGQYVREYPFDKPMYSHEEMMRIVQVQAKSIIKFLDEEKPNLIIFTVVGCVGALLLYQIAKKRGIPILITSETRMDNECTLTEDYKSLTWAETIYNKFKTDGIESKKIIKARNYLKKFRTDPLSCLTYWGKNDFSKNKSRRSNYKWFLPKNLYQSFFWLIKTAGIYIGNKKYRDYDEINPLYYFIDRFKRKIRMLIGFEYLYDQINYEEDYAFFPLHYEPEVAISLFAPFWTDQINLIRQIAKSLPLHYKLYVKEHPNMVGYRTHAYYKELKKIPNVKLINPDILAFPIIKNAKLVTALSTSSAGWEAVLLKKPVVTFSNASYSRLSMVKNCDDIEQLPYLVKEQLENFRHNETDLENFIGSIMEVSLPVNLSKIWYEGIKEERDKQALIMMADLIAKKFVKPL